MANRTAFFNGQWIEEGALRLPVNDLGFTQGVTATERLRTFSGAPYRVADHMDRLRRSCEILDLPAAELVAEIEAAIHVYAKHNAELIDSGDDWSISAFVTPGSGAGPTRCVHGAPLAFGQWAHQFLEGVSLHVSDHRQTPASCWPTELKCRSRMHYYLADRQAERTEPGSKGLLLDQQGFVGETSTANVVALFGDQGVVSPRVDKVLPGVSLGVVRGLVAELGLAFSERDLRPEELHDADEVWLCSTSVCALPVVRFNGRPIAGGTPGPEYQRLMLAWSDAVGLDIAAQADRFAGRGTG